MDQIPIIIIKDAHPWIKNNHHHEGCLATMMSFLWQKILFLTRKLSRKKTIEPIHLKFEFFNKKCEIFTPFANFSQQISQKL